MKSGRRRIFRGGELNIVTAPPLDSSLFPPIHLGGRSKMTTSVLFI